MYNLYANCLIVIPLRNYENNDKKRNNLLKVPILLSTNVDPI